MLNKYAKSKQINIKVRFMQFMNPANKKIIFAQASVLKRAAAFAIDILTVNLIILFPFDTVYRKIVPSDSFSEAFRFLSSNANSTSIRIIIMSASIVTILYFVIFEKKLRQTPGKMLFRLYVKEEGKDLKYWQLFIRSMFLMPLFPFVLLWIIDPIVMLFTKDNQRLSEILSRTKVVEEYKV